MNHLLIGRDVEEDQLRELVRNVAGGEGRSVLVEGEPGIGKSSLISAGLAGAADLGCRVLRGAADEYGGRFPLRVLHDSFVNAGVGDVASMTGGEWGNALSGAYDPVLAAMERLIEVVDKLCANSPVVLAIDDLQWADEPSMAVWAQLSKLAGQLPLLLVAASRTEPQRAELATLRRTLLAHDAVMIRLGPLSRKQTVALIGDLVGAPPGAELTRLAVRAGGNPLYVRELMDVLAREGRLKIERGVTADVERGGEIPVPTSLRAAIADRVESMSENTQRIVQSAALLGPEFSVADLATMLGRSAPHLTEALMEAYRANVLVDSGSRTAFRHPLIREVLYGGIPEGLRIALHRQAAEALAEAGVPVERVGEQLQAAAGVMDAWMLNWLVDNGAALVNRASQPAIDLLARAAEHIPRTDPRREVIESRMVAALRRMLRFGEVAQRTRAMLASESISTEHRLEMSWALAYSLLYSSPPEGARVAREAIAHDDGGRWGGRVRAMLALILAVDRHCGDPLAAIRDAHAAGQRTGDRWTQCTALQAEAMVTGEHDLRRSTELFQQALATIGDDPQTSDVRVVLVANLIRRLDELGRPDEADTLLADILSFAERFPSAIGMTRVQVYAAERHLGVGQWDDALAELESAEPRAEHGYIAFEALSTGALIAGHRDDRASATAQLAALDALPVGAEVIRNHSTKLVLARALLEERDGRPGKALEVLLPMLDPELDFEPTDRIWWLPELVRLAMAVGERDVAQTATEQAIADAGYESGLPYREAGAAACRGLLAGDPELLLAAAEKYRVCRFVLDRGIALENAAVLFAEQGDLTRARAAIDAATEEYTKLAATWDMTRAEARMRPFGIRRGQRGPRGRPASGWDSLTPTELRVAFFIADGLSNPGIATELFLSRRTVQTHVSHILAKLNARSRAEVASEAARRRNRPPGGGPPRSRSASLRRRR